MDQRRPDAAKSGIQRDSCNSTLQGDSAGSNRLAAMLPCVLVVVLLVTCGCRSESAAPASAVKGEQTITPATETDSAPTLAISEQDRFDDGSLWVSPTDGPPLDTRYLPLGTSLLLHVRPSELLAHDEGETVLASLGPWGTAAVEQIETLTGTPLDEMKTLMVAAHSGGDYSGEGGWAVTLRVELSEAISSEQLAERFADSPVRRENGIEIIEPNGRAVFLPPVEAGRMLVSTPREEVEELLLREDDSLLLSREMESVLSRSDAHRTATLLIPNKFFQTSGRELLGSEGAELLADALSEVLPPQATALAISLDWQEHFFCEVWSAVELNMPSHRFANQVSSEAQELGQRVGKYLSESPPSEHGRAVVERLPAMLDMLGRHTRVSHQRGLSVARCYLPVTAGHNLVMAAELLVNLPSIGPAASSPEPTLNRRSVAEKLQQVTSFSFQRESLEEALELLAADVGVTLELVGSDLQLEGITKNQMISLDMQERPAGEILLEILKVGNPDTEATSLHDRRQKLVYVVREGEAAEIIVTTRSAAEERGDELPDVFQSSYE